jgi:capsular polysaccharide biosynthesis protein
MRRRARRAARWAVRRARRSGAALVDDLPALLRSFGRGLTSHLGVRQSLLDAWIADGQTVDPDTEDFLRQLAVGLHGLAARRIAVFTGPRSDRLPTLIVERWADAHVLQLGGVTPVSEESPVGQSSERITWSVPTSVSQRHALLTVEGPFDALVDVTGDPPDQQLERLRETLFHVRRRGLYVARTDVDSSGEQPLADAIAGMVADRPVADGSSTHRDDPSYAAAIGHVTRSRSSIRLSVETSALAKTRYAELDQMMALRPHRVCTIEETRPARRFRSACVVTANRPELNRRMPAEFKVPAMALRRYDDVVCAPHQVLIKDSYLIPDTFRHPANARLTNHLLTDLTPLFAAYPRRLDAPARLRGEYFYLGSEYPQLFGHVLTEQLSRLWAWRAAKLIHPRLKALVPLRSRAGRLTSFERQIFTAAGVDTADIVTPSGPVRVDHLLAASPMLVNPQYIHPEIAVQWDEVGDSLDAMAAVADTPAKLFVSRKRAHAKRTCRNADDVEAIATRFGFTVVYPEDHSLPQQVRMFRKAEAIAGYAGSGLFTLAFCPEPTRLILLSSENYTARNEYLIASVRGHPIDLVWCPAEHPFVDGVWTRAAFQSDYRVDLERDGDHLEGLFATG